MPLAQKPNCTLEFGAIRLLYDSGLIVTPSPEALHMLLKLVPSMSSVKAQSVMSAEPRLLTFPSAQKPEPQRLLISIVASTGPFTSALALLAATMAQAASSIFIVYLIMRKLPFMSLLWG